MKIIDKINSTKGPFYSFEYFPPKTDEGVENLYRRLERMALLEPSFVDVTWGAGGTTAQLTLEISANAQKYIGLETMMHLTCTNMPATQIHEALLQAKEAGIKNILALRGDPPIGAESWEKCESGFGQAADLVEYIRREFGDYFGVCVAGYPEGHSECADVESDMAYLKAKVDAGADFIITQLFYDVDMFLEFVAKARDIGITCPIIPGVMPIQNYSAFKRMTTFCKTKVPKDIFDRLEPIKEDDAKVKDYGVELGVSMCQKMLKAGIPGIHFYTLNLETSVKRIMQGLGFLISEARAEEGEGYKRLPWQTSEVQRRATEAVRPIFWANRPHSYMQRTLTWDEFPNGRWGDSRSPAFGDLADYHIFSAMSVSRIKDRQKLWGEAPQTLKDIYSVFEALVDGQVSYLPWCQGPLQSETKQIWQLLKSLNRNGFLTINSQPSVNGASSSDKSFGWGASNGYVYQKAYLEFFTSEANLQRIISVIGNFPMMTFYAINAEGRSYSNVNADSEGQVHVNAVTWGVFPNSEIIQPTVVDSTSFKVWKDEAFGLWISQWGNIYPKNSPSRNLIQDIHDKFFLVNIVDNDYVNSDLSKFVNTLESTSVMRSN
uniref:methylenetetrahydrofolate reductase (NADH) n=1 Tax=Spongospora subterranea TaxID=70186 RepID=A0A0H5RI09_9EUKA|eukprot:CRZ08304.1 hypothetical protein [Spongospora subterranea]